MGRGVEPVPGKPAQSAQIEPVVRADDDVSLVLGLGHGLEWWQALDLEAMDGMGLVKASHDPRFERRLDPLGPP